MFAAIVSSSEPVTLVGGGQVDRRDLNISLRSAPRLVAADAGADRLLALGETPEAVIGDLDSLSETASGLLADRLHKVPEQDTTDFEKSVQRITAPAILALGFSGGRLDHVLAVLNAMVRLRHRRVVLFGPSDIAFVAPRDLTLDLAPGDPVALMPMETCEVSSAGLEWDLDRSVLSPSGSVSSSNRATGKVRIVSRGSLLITLAARRLDVALAAVRAG